MEKITSFIVNKRKWIITLVALLTIFCVFLIPKVKVNYDMSEYLPKDSEVAKGMDIMEDEFGLIGNAQVMFKNIEANELEDIYSKLINTQGVNAVDFDATNEKYYKDNNALFILTLEDGDYSNEAKDTVEKIRTEFKSYDIALSGTSVSADSMSKSIADEMPIFFIIAIVLIIVILLLISTSWIEPIIFLSISGIAIVLNYGTNIIFSQVSFVTFAIAAILQLALSMDYSIMLLDQYHHELKDSPKNEAMKKALRKSFATVSSSSLTTIFGLLAMVFMSFTIGKDLGFVLAKGILINVLVVFLALPALILIFDKLLNKTKKKPIRIPVNFLAKFGLKGKYVITVIMFFLVIGAFLVQNNLKLEYAYNLTSDEIKEVEDNFNKSNQVVILYDKNTNSENVYNVIDFLNNYKMDNENILVNVVDYNNTFGMELSAEEASAMSGMNIKTVKNIYNLYSQIKEKKYEKIPVDDLIAFIKENVMTNKQYQSLLTEEVIHNLNLIDSQLNENQDLLVSENYNRMIINLDMKIESEESFKFYDDLKDVTNKNLDKSYILGETAVAYDIKESFGNELLLITILTVISMIIIIAITFRSFSIPIILVALIQGAIWISMSYPVVTNQPLYFLAYIIAQCIQMGATIDYAILLSSNYVNNRKKHNKEVSIKNALKSSILTIFTSASILIAATFTIAIVSSQELISTICLVIGRGTIVSTIVVLLVLPAFLIISDKLIEKTTYKTKFVKEKNESEN